MEKQLHEVAKELREKGINFWLIADDGKQIIIKTDKKDIIIPKGT